MPRLLPILLSLAFAASSRAAAQTFALPAASLADSAGLAHALPSLAEQIIPVYHDTVRPRYLDNLFRLELVSGRYDEAERSLAELHALRIARPGGATAIDLSTNVQYAIYARARAAEKANARPFSETFPAAFRAELARVDARTSGLVIRSFRSSLGAMEENLKRAVTGQAGKQEIQLADALMLIKRYQMADAYRAFAPLSPALVAEDDARRYDITQDLIVRTPDGASICVLIVRPRAAPARRPALMEFSIYSDSIARLNEARRSASNGYVGVEALTRGKGCSRDEPVAYEHDGADAAAVIDWIARQPWSDGRVGMFGGSYNGFSQWAAAKRHPKALKALMPSVSVAPGIDVPMDGNLFLTFTYPWTVFAVSGHQDDSTHYLDSARWARMTRKWYAKGLAYRALDSIDGTPNPTFRRWLEHPSYDAYWKAMIPYGTEFSGIELPVLATTGYYDGGQIGALYYFREHHRYNPRAEQYLVIGPYDHVRGQRGTVTGLGDTLTNLFGYDTDPAAQLDIGELRYQWFDYVFRSAPKPAILAGTVNYEVMGANRWKHAPTLAAMGPHRLRLYLTAGQRPGAARLSPAPATTFIPQTFDLADRRDVDSMPVGGNLVDRTIDTTHAIAFVSDPLAEGAELSGLFSGMLDVVTDKRDFDFNVQLYELTPGGDYVQLSYYWVRASHAGDREHRRLLVPGARQRIPFEAGRLTSRQFAKGSRIVMVLSLIRQQGTQINYGTGKDVSDETIADAGEPLRVRWYGTSWLEVPLAR